MKHVCQKTSSQVRRQEYLRRVVNGKNFFYYYRFENALDSGDFKQPLRKQIPTLPYPRRSNSLGVYLRERTQKRLLLEINFYKQSVYSLRNADISVLFYRTPSVLKF